MECPSNTEIIQRQEHLHICLGCFIAATIEVSFSPLSYYSSAMEMNPSVAVFTVYPTLHWWEGRPFSRNRKGYWQVYSTHHKYV